MSAPEYGWRSIFSQRHCAAGRQALADRAGRELRRAEEPLHEIIAGDGRESGHIRIWADGSLLYQDGGRTELWASAEDWMDEWIGQGLGLSRSMWELLPERLRAQDLLAAEEVRP